MKKWPWTNILEYVMAALIVGYAVLLFLAAEYGWFK